MVDFNDSEIVGRACAVVLDAACLDELRALDPDGQARLVQRVLATYQTSLVRLVEQLRQARTEANWDQVSRVAHTLKSSSASIGALSFASLCADIEGLLREGDHAGAAPLLDRFNIESGRVEGAVRQALSAMEGTSL